MRFERGRPSQERLQVSPHSVASCVDAVRLTPAACGLQVLNEFLRATFADAVAYAGACMIRRLGGFSHVADMDSIKDTDVR